MFERYAGGGWSVRSLAAWLNADARVPRRPGGQPWRADAVRNILRRPEYAGLVRFNRRHKGVYTTGGPLFVVPGRHPALVSRELWDTVQQRMDAARKRQTYNARRPNLELATGLLRCERCGGLMVTHHHSKPNRQPTYMCLNHDQQKTRCGYVGYRADVAHAALQAEVCRLQAAPWEDQRLVGPPGSVRDRTAQLTAEIAAERERMRRHVRRLGLLEREPSPEEMAAYHVVSAEITGAIAALEAQLDEAGRHVQAVPSLRALHNQFLATPPATVVADLVAQEDAVGLRELVLGLVESARLIERRLAFRSTWIRLEVTWTRDVQTLLEAGLLTLTLPAPPPHIPDQRERWRLAWRRKYGKDLRYRL